MSNEVKRYWNGQEVGPEVANSVVTAADHDRIVAEKDAEIRVLKEAAEVLRNREWSAENEDELKAQLAKQAKVIEKLKAYAAHKVDCICRAGVLQYSDDCDCGLAAIERGEG